MHKIEVKNKVEEQGQLSKGANTEIYIDGQRAKFVKSFKYEVDAKGVAVVTLEYYADISLESNVPDIVAEGIILSKENTHALGGYLPAGFKGEEELDDECK